MSPTDGTRADPRPKAQAIAADTWGRTVSAMGSLVERITPWLLDLGNWIFGGLIAFNLVLLSALLTVGPVDRAVLVATTGLALALPLDVAGFALLRFAADMKEVDLDQAATAAFVEAGFSVEQEAGAASPADVEKRRAGVVLRYSYGLLAASIILTVVAVTGALWHMAWWIGVAFVVMAVLSQVVVSAAIVSAGSDNAWRSPAGEVEKQSSRS